MNISYFPKLVQESELVLAGPLVDSVSVPVLDTALVLESVSESAYLLVSELAYLLVMGLAYLLVLGLAYLLVPVLVFLSEKESAVKDSVTVATVVVIVLAMDFYQSHYLTIIQPY